MAVAASRTGLSGHRLLMLRILVRCFLTAVCVKGSSPATFGEASCDSSSQQVLLQRHSRVHQSTVPAERASQRNPWNTEAVKFLADVPVYNYGYIKRLEECEEDGCELEFLQTGDNHNHSGHGDDLQDWERDMVRNDQEQIATPSPEEARHQKDSHLPFRGYHRLRPGRTREWLVKMKDGISDQLIHNFCDVLPGTAKCLAEGHPSEGGIPMVVVKGTEDELEEQLRRHQGKSDYVEPDVEMNAIPEVRSKEEEDEDYWDKVHYYSGANRTGKGARRKGKGLKDTVDSESTGSHKPSSWGLDRIDQRSGLDDQYLIGPEGGKGVHIYVADTGIRTTHHDFNGRALPTLEIRKGIIRECEGESSKCAQDEDGHGTHAAATIGGRVYGVARASTIHSVKILSAEGRGKMSYLIQALDWVATKGERPAVFTTSVGAEFTPPSVGKAIEAASAAGVTVIVAAGNLGRDACGFTPAHVKQAITVAATENSQDKIATYSNYGECVDLFAPGSDIHSAGRMSDTAKATMTGTSMATPHVAGAAALLLGEDNTRTPEEVSLLLKARATQGSIQGAPGHSPDMLLFTAPLEDADIIYWQSGWLPKWWKLLHWTSWVDIVRPGPMKELMAEAFVCCLFLVALAFVLTRCVRTLSLPPGMHETA